MTRRDHDEGISARAEAISGVPGLVYVKGTSKNSRFDRG